MYQGLVLIILIFNYLYSTKKVSPFGGITILREDDGIEAAKHLGIARRKELDGRVTGKRPV